MTTTTDRRTALRVTEREVGAFACLDAAGNLYWVRIFESSINPRNVVGRRYELPNGSPVHYVEDDLYLVFCLMTHEWIEIESIASRKRRAHAN